MNVSDPVQIKSAALNADMKYKLPPDLQNISDFFLVQSSTELPADQQHIPAQSFSYLF